ncbi:putative WD repeat-containing protein [Psilocybe cubensis]|uniref:WD repeat-containing protein n=2 Tax=Psilocybe cubensis TaxID=181762 RepID=A0ACB8H8I1_PSICU|nr:putative WD repeat-containing protein [Psilocybe cubensis]KAH9484171.1 putative WD repeat-containing protein [Psilocybe cubensis]
MSTDNFIVTEAQLAIEEARKQKAERTKSLGDPIELIGKALAIEIQDSVAWIGENTNVARLLDLESGKTLHLFKGHTGPVTSLAFCDRTPGSGDREILITGSWDKSIRLWDTVSKRQISSTPNAHADFVKTLHVFSSLNLLVSGSSDKIVRFWDISQPTSSEPLISLGSISSHTRPVECLDGEVVSPDAAILYTGDTMGVIKSWDLIRESGSPSRWKAIHKQTINHHRTRINDLWYKNGQLWTASADDTVRVLSQDASDGTTKLSKPIMQPVAVRTILPISLTDLGEPYLITAAGDVLRTYDVSELDEPDLISEIDAHWHDITAVKLWMRKTIGEDGKTRIEPWILSTSLDKTIRRWKLSELLHPATPPKKTPENLVAEPTPKPASSSELTEEEERELAELMDD